MTESDNSTPYLAEFYDAQVRKTIPYYEEFLKETINVIKAMHMKPKTWLDTGCGTGTLVQKAIAEFQNTQFILVDPSPQMLEAASKKLAGHRPGRVKFLPPSTTQNLPKSLHFDVITAIQSHHYLFRHEREKATAVCFELLTPHGIYVTFENIRPFTSNGVAIGSENWKQFQLMQGRDQVSVDEHMKRFDVNFHPITVKEHISLLRKTGFSTVEMLWYSYMQAGFYCIK